MDFSNAALLAVVVFAAVEGLKRIIPNLNDRLLVPLVLLLGIGATMLVAHTAWAPNQVIDGISLDKLNSASQAVAGLLIGGLAVGIDNALKAVKNVGQNQ